MRHVVLVAVLAAVTGCTSPPSEPAVTPTQAPAAVKAKPTAEQLASASTAYFAGGCFWGVEHYLEQMDGVLAVESGYMGGHVQDPSYWDVASQTSGHLETVRVRFDEGRVSYEAVAKRFFEIHDPTQADGQGPDIGPEYRSAVFYTDAAQQATTQGLIERLKGRGLDVVTEVRPAEKFWVAEGNHQDYYAKSGKTPYCHVRTDRFGDGGGKS